MGPFVVYPSSAQLLADWQSQLSRGGLLVRAEPPDGTQQFANVTLTIVSPQGRVALSAQLMQHFPGVGAAVTFAADGKLDALVDAARSANDGEASSDDPLHGWGDPPAERATVNAENGPSAAALAGRAAQEKMGLALRGNRDERTVILREGNPTLQGYLLRNPGLQLDEVLQMAKMRTVTPELLKQIADRREWVSRPDIATALVRNPKTPVGIAIRILDHVPAAELRQLAKDNNTRAQIQTAARRKIVG